MRISLTVAAARPPADTFAMALLQGIGKREVVALVALAVALVVTAAYCNPKSTNHDVPARVIATVTPTVVETAWQVSWLEGPSFDDSIVTGQGELDELAFDYAAAPFPGTKDDDWGMVARTEFAGAPGRYLLSLEYRGEIGLTIADEERRITPSPGEGSILIPFEQEGPAATPIVVRFHDSGGPARLALEIRK